ncbi:MAG: flagellar filament capping protein FliD [Bacillota bacterium]
MTSPFSIGGLASGIDTESMIQKLMEIEARPLQLLQQKKTDLTSLQGTWRDVNSRLANLQARARDLTKAYLFNAKAATSSDEEIATAVASTSVPSGVYNLSITRLAQAHSIGSKIYSSASQQLNLSGTFSLNGKSIQVLTTDTLNSLANKINNTSGTGVTASVMTISGSEYRLVLTSNSTGQNSAINFNTVTSSDPAVTVTTDPAVAAGTHTIQVTALATGASSVSTATSATANGTMNFSIGGQSIGTLEVRAGETASQLATRINSAFAGKLTATTNGSSQLSVSTVALGSAQDLTIDDGGVTGLGPFTSTAGSDASVTIDGVDYNPAANNLTVGGLTYAWTATQAAPATVTVQRDPVLDALELWSTGAGDYSHELVAAQDAAFSINGVDMTRSKNTIDDAINGIAITLLKGGNSTATLTVGADTKKVSDAIHSWVDQYNSTIDFITQAVNYDTVTKKPGALYSDSSLRDLRQRLVQATTGEVKNIPGLYKALSQVGIHTAAWGEADFGTGKLSIDETKLDAALKDHLDDVAQLFGAKPVNVAAAGNGATAADPAGAYDPALEPVYGASNAIDGNKSSDFWGTAGGGWQSLTQVPATLQVNFSAAKWIDTINLTMLDSALNPAATSSLKDFSLEYSNDGGASWIPLETVTGNTLGYKSFTFDAVSATNIRLKATATNSPDGLAKVVELEALQQSSGIASVLDREIGRFTETSGVIDEKQKSLTDQIRDLDTRIANTQDRLDLKEQSMRARFTAMEKALSSMKNQSAWFDSQLSALNNNG